MNAKLSAAAAAILWGFTYVLTTTWLPPHPLFLAAFRALGGALVLLVIVRCVPPRVWWGRLAVLGTLIYKACLTGAMLLGLPANYLKLLMSALFVVALMSGRFMGGRGKRLA